MNCIVLYLTMFIHVSLDLRYSISTGGRPPIVPQPADTPPSIQSHKLPCNLQPQSCRQEQSLASPDLGLVAKRSALGHVISEAQTLHYSRQLTNNVVAATSQGKKDPPRFAEYIRNFASIQIPPAHRACLLTKIHLLHPHSFTR